MIKNKKLIRTKFRDGVFQRDHYSCQVCGFVSNQNQAAADLDAHHITDRTLMPNGGYVLENGITVCKPCHQLAEVWHQSNQQSFEVGLHPDDLYQIIGSTYQKALAKSERLK